MRRDLPALAEAAAALVLARLAVRLVPFRWLAPSAGHPDAGAPATTRAAPEAATIGRLIGRAADRLPWRSTCLVRALAARLLLRRRGIASVLWIGVTKENGDIAAHAWLLAGGGVVCGGREAPGYTPIATIATGCSR